MGNDSAPEVVFVDNPSRKRVDAIYVGAGRHITLWSGAAYDAIGEWTQAQAESRLAELAGVS